MTTYAVNDIYPALQGEGMLAGTPMVLLRLHGCPVGCPWCDTKETWHLTPEHKVSTLAGALGTNPNWTEATATEIASYIAAKYSNLQWVLLTGGEPAMQPLQPLIDALHAKHFQVAIETSGTADGVLRSGCDWVCVSPKIKMPGGRAVLPEVVQMADEIKFVIGKQADIDRIAAYIEEWSIVPEWQTISLQPLSQSSKATQMCIDAAMATGWRISLQMHKYLNLR